MSISTKIKLHDLLFPQLSDKKWEPINLNEFAEITHQFREMNFLDPDQMGEWVNCVHKDLGCDYSYGGYLEDRSHIWAGSYIKPSAATHLGIDFNVPTSTMVHSPVDGEVVDRLYDPTDFGWGTRLTLCVRQDLYIVFAHLYPYLNVKLGEKVKKGAWLGVVAPKEHNGGWYEHLHVQLLTKRLTDFDGYIKRYDGIELDYPDPEVILGEINGGD